MRWSFTAFLSAEKPNLHTQDISHGQGDFFAMYYAGILREKCRINKKYNRNNVARQLTKYKNMGIELVEVKSGNDYKTHSALNRIRNTEGWKFSKASVFCKGNVELENGVWYFLWYVILFAKPFQAPKEMKYEIDLSVLL